MGNNERISTRMGKNEKGSCALTSHESVRDLAVTGHPAVTSRLKRAKKPFCFPFETGEDLCKMAAAPKLRVDLLRPKAHS
ncbi:hypothetical protein FKM82_025086 [Ascaphus truei]